MLQNPNRRLARYTMETDYSVCSEIDRVAVWLSTVEMTQWFVTFCRVFRQLSNAALLSHPQAVIAEYSTLAGQPGSR